MSVTATPSRARDGRSSLFARTEVERLAARSRGGGRAGALEVVVDTELTLLDPAGALAYRGRDATALARTATYERVAGWLWTGADDGDGGAPWPVRPEARTVGLAARDALPGRASTADRVRAIVPAIAATDPLRGDLRPAAVVATARDLIATTVSCLPRVDGAPADPDGEAGTVAERLWARLTPRPPEPPLVRILDAALVLLADHGLAASTLAARVAASTHANPYLVVTAGLGALGGPLHGAASRAVEELLNRIAEPADAPYELGRELERGQPVPGFGHAVYTDRDPRADTLLDLLAAAVGADANLRVVRAVADAVGERGGPAPNVDFALAALTTAARLAPGAGETLFTVARMAGWIAHALEEYQHRLRFRPRALYTGPRP